MLSVDTKRRIDTARDILVGKLPDPKSQVEQITIALIYKFMHDMDKESEELGGKAKFFTGEYKKYAWSKIFDPKISGFELVNVYGEAIQRMNQNPNIPQLFRDIFKNAYLPYRDPETLKSFLKSINDFHYDHSERLGDAFEYLLSVLGSQGEAGQFRTPRHIIDFMVEIVDPKKNESILDPACGTAGFLISSYKHILKYNSKNFDSKKDPKAFELHGVKLDEITINSKKYRGDKLNSDEKERLANNIVGYDISPDMVRLSLVNMYLHGFSNPKISEYDTLTSEAKWNEYADVIMANPPFMSPKGGIRPHKRFSIESKRSEVLFVDYIAEHLTPQGKSAVIVPEGIIFQTQTAYKNLRKILIEKNYLVGVISLPAGVFNPYSGVKTSILWIDRALAKRTNKILFVKINNDGFDLGAQRRPINENDLPETFRGICAYKEFLNTGKKFNVDKWNNVLLVEKNKFVENSDYNLSGERYREDVRVKTSEFDCKNLGGICDIFNGSTPSRKEKSYWDNGNVPWFTIEDVRKQGRVITGTAQKVTEKALRKTSIKVLPKNSVLLCCTASVGEYAFSDIELTTNQQFNGLVIKKEYRDKILPKFLFYLSAAFKDELLRISGKTSFNFVSVKVLKNLKIPIPPLSFQKEIVVEFDNYQKIIDGARQVVNNYKLHIDIDPKWERVKLADITKRKIESGFPITKKDVVNRSKNKFVNIYDIYQGYEIDILSLPYIKDKNYQGKYLEKGDIAFVRVSLKEEGAAYSALFNCEDANVVYGDNILRFRPAKKVDPHYLVYLLRTNEYREAILRICNRANVTSINTTNLNNFKVPIPSLIIQQEIVARIQNERKLVESNKKLINLFEQKIKDRIVKVWGV